MNRISLLAGVMAFLLGLVPGASAQSIDDAIEKFFAPGSVVGRIARDFPAERAEAEVRLRTAWARGGQAQLDEASASLMGDLGARYTRHYVLHAGDSAVLGFVGMMVVALQDLQAQGDAECVAYIAGTPTTFTFSPEALEVMKSAFEDLVLGAGSSPGHLLEGEDVQTVGGQIFAKMYEVAPEDVYIPGHSNPRAMASPDELASTCKSFIGYYKAMGLLDPSDAAAFLRGSVSGG